MQCPSVWLPHLDSSFLKIASICAYVILELSPRLNPSFSCSVPILWCAPSADSNQTPT